MLRWNERFGIRFMRLSSEMFPFASHPEHGYRLAPFASEALADAAGPCTLVNSLNSGSPRREVIESSIRDLEYHAEMLGLLKLPPQQDLDAVMIIHMGIPTKDALFRADTVRYYENAAAENTIQGIKNKLFFDLMKTYKLPGFEKMNEIIPHVRPRELEDGIDIGGPEGRVYWPVGMEHWLRPEKRVVKRKMKNDEPGSNKSGPRTKAMAEESEGEGIMTKRPARRKSLKAKAKSKKT
ncbi:UV-endonuclease UVE-1 [Coccidioides immitis RMSCC 3703]|uniref:UV-endonuclease UVE-1 n=1 Tax=Coccidioides immitis RMSCC 3703 TaxID=454286 RepID=A0A0J8QNK5_COCIT|nr:UV-endonuclease UVE-1 [Coccidioides immitis RMSCC 3703]